MSDYGPKEQQIIALQAECHELHDTLNSSNQLENIRELQQQNEKLEGELEQAETDRLEERKARRWAINKLAETEQEVSALQSELAECKVQIERVRRCEDRWMVDYGIKCAELESFKQQNEKLREGLRWYVDYMDTEISSKARKILEETK